MTTLAHIHTTTSQLLFVDTEGFESTGRANSYDDRIFAVAAVMSSLLVYNLPETIRASDVAKLSFAVELAAGFYEGTAGASVRPSAGGGAEVGDSKCWGFAGYGPVLSCCPSQMHTKLYTQQIPDIILLACCECAHVAVGM